MHERHVGPDEAGRIEGVVVDAAGIDRLENPRVAAGNHLTSVKMLRSNRHEIRIGRESSSPADTVRRIPRGFQRLHHRLERHPIRLVQLRHGIPPREYQSSTRRARSVFHRLGLPSPRPISTSILPACRMSSGQRPSASRLDATQSPRSCARRAERRRSGSIRGPAARRSATRSGTQKRSKGRRPLRSTITSPVDRRRRRRCSSRYSCPRRRASIIVGWLQPECSYSSSASSTQIVV